MIMKATPFFSHATLNPMENITMVIVGIFIFCVIIGLIIFAIKQNRKKNSKPVIKMNDWRKKNNLKVFSTILLITSLALTSTVSASDTLIVKQNKTVYYFHIENYRELNMYVLSDVLVNPTVSDLAILKIPKASCDFINRVEDGIFFTYVDKLEKQLALEKKKNRQLIIDQQKTQSLVIAIIIASLVFMAIGFPTVLYLSYRSKKSETIPKKTENKNSEKKPEEPTGDCTFS